MPTPLPLFLAAGRLLLVLIEKSGARNNRRRQVSDGASRERSERSERESEAAVSARQEDRENKGPPSGRPGNRTARAVLEEANNASGSASKLRRRGVVKSPVESLPQRTVRRRPRPGNEVKEGSRSVREDSEQEDQPGEKSDKEERLESRSEEEEDEEEEEDCDPLIKRLKTTGHRKTRAERKSRENEVEEAIDEEVPASNVDPEDTPKDEPEEDEESESRERDREPEPPPPNKVDPGGPKESSQDPVEGKSEEAHGQEESVPEVVVQKSNEVPVKVLSSRDIIPEATDLLAEDRKVSRSRSNEVTILTEGTEPEEDSVGSASGGVRAGSVESVVELLESSSQDGSVLERLSPLSSGPGRQSLLLEEQERNRHNESPVILAERLNKPPPAPGHHHHHSQQHPLQYHHHHYSSAGSPVIQSQHQGSSLREAQQQQHQQQLHHQVTSIPSISGRR
ncbi:ABC transporter F family member 4 [Cephus cinctus]|uniref:ABC transporter F family member 4 n=1 Tax=Cephus cinctus TaxID=211228 RepID=A0AAJ7CEY6_CEPCN|nr:ABC transporter F family member 4 [Cephus cinctus]